MELKQEDIPILNYILTETLKSGRINVKHLKPLKDDIFAGTDGQTVDYERYLVLINENGAAKVKSNVNVDQTWIDAIPVTTEEYVEYNRFQQHYDEQQKDIDLKIIKENKLRADATVSKWTKWTYWPLVVISVTALILSLINYFSDKPTP